VVDRHASEKEKLKDLPTYKDKDFLGDRRVLCVGSEVRQKLLSVFQADTEVVRLFVLDTFESWNDSILIFAVVCCCCCCYCTLLHVFIFSLSSTALNTPKVFAVMPCDQLVDYCILL